jgi:hypothetical protein
MAKKEDLTQITSQFQTLLKVAENLTKALEKTQGSFSAMRAAGEKSSKGLGTGLRAGLKNENVDLKRLMFQDSKLKIVGHNVGQKLAKYIKQGMKAGNADILAMAGKMPTPRSAKSPGTPKTPRVENVEIPTPAQAPGLISMFGGIKLATLGAVSALGMFSAVSIGAGAGLYGMYKFGSMAVGKMREVESQIIRLTTAHQDSAKAVKDYQEAVLFASKTPFSVGSVTESVAVLRTFQFNPFRDVGGGRNMLEMLGDMAGALGVDLATATHALYRAQVGEWEIMQNNFQISAKMIPQLKGLTSGTKEYRDAIVDYLSQQDRFRDGMKFTVDSIRGLMSNITDAMGIVLIGIGSVVESKKALKGLTFYDAVKDSLKPLYEAVSQSSDLKTYMQEMAKVDLGKKNLGEVKSQFGDKYFQDLQRVTSSFSTIQRQQAELEKLGYGTDKVYAQGERLMYLGNTIGQFFRVIWETFISPFITALANGVEWLLTFNESFTNNVVKKFLGGGAQIGEKAEDTTQVMKILSETYGVSIDEIINKTGGMMSGIRDLAKKESLETMTNLQKTLLWFTIAMEFVKLAIEAYLTDLSGFMAAKIRKIWQEAVPDPKALSDALDAFLTAGSRAFATAGSLFTNSFKVAFSAISILISGFMSGVALSGTGFFDKLLTLGGALLDLFSNITTLIAGLFGLGGGELTGNMERLNDLGYFVGEAFGLILDTLIWITDLLNTAFKFLLDHLTEIVNMLDWFVGLFEYVEPFVVMLVGGFAAVKLQMLLIKGISFFSTLITGFAGATAAAGGLTGVLMTGVLTAIEVISTAIKNIPVIGWIAAVIAGLIYMYIKFDWFRNLVNEVGMFLLNWANPIGLIINLVKYLYHRFELVRKIIDSVAEFLAPVINAVNGLIGKAVNVVGGFFKTSEEKNPEGKPEPENPETKGGNALPVLERRPAIRNASMFSGGSTASSQKVVKDLENSAKYSADTAKHTKDSKDLLGRLISLTETTNYFLSIVSNQKAGATQSTLQDRDWVSQILERQSTRTEAYSKSEINREATNGGSVR